MIKKTIEIAETVIPASTIDLPLIDFTGFLENGEIKGIRTTLGDQHQEFKKGDVRLTDKHWTDLETAIANIIAVDTDEQTEVNKKAYEAVLVDARQKAFDKAVADGIITAEGFPIEKIII